MPLLTVVALPLILIVYVPNNLSEGTTPDASMLASKPVRPEPSPECDPEKLVAVAEPVTTNEPADTEDVITALSASRVVNFPIPGAVTPMLTSSMIPELIMTEPVKVGLLIGALVATSVFRV